jgi:aspartate/glutamate racemase
MKTLGIIGGIGPESTIEYYRRIDALYRERIRDGSAFGLLQKVCEAGGKTRRTTAVSAIPI